MINNVTLVGRLTADPKSKEAKNNLAISNFSIAITTNAKVDKTLFLNCVAFGKNAENINKYFKKGNLIGLTGSLQSNSYQNKEGQNIEKIEVLVNTFTFLETKKENNTYNNNINKHTVSENHENMQKLIENNDKDDEYISFIEEGEENDTPNW